MPKPIPSASPSWSCAASSCCAAGNWNGSTRKAHRACSRKPGRRIEAIIPEAERGDFIAAYHQRLTSDDEAVRLAAAKAWATWEGATSYLHIDPDYETSHGDAHFALAFARIENHYFTNKGFFDVDDQLLRDAHRIKDIPGVIVHGRYDVVCPIQSAFDLHKAWPKAKLHDQPGLGPCRIRSGNRRCAGRRHRPLCH